MYFVFTSQAFTQMHYNGNYIPLDSVWNKLQKSKISIYNSREFKQSCLA